jgi:hypothetical protein
VGISRCLDEAGVACHALIAVLLYAAGVRHKAKRAAMASRELPQGCGDGHTHRDIRSQMRATSASRDRAPPPLQRGPRELRAASTPIWPHIAMSPDRLRPYRDATRQQQQEAAWRAERSQQQAHGQRQRRSDDDADEARWTAFLQMQEHHQQRAAEDRRSKQAWRRELDAAEHIPLDRALAVVSPRRRTRDESRDPARLRSPTQAQRRREAATAAASARRRQRLRSPEQQRPHGALLLTRDGMMMVHRGLMGEDEEAEVLPQQQLRPASMAAPPSDFTRPQSASAAASMTPTTFGSSKSPRYPEVHSLPTSEKFYAAVSQGHGMPPVVSVMPCQWYHYPSTGMSSGLTRCACHPESIFGRAI